MNLKLGLPLCLLLYIILNINCNFRGNLRSISDSLMSHFEINSLSLLLMATIALEFIFYLHIVKIFKNTSVERIT